MPRTRQTSSTEGVVLVERSPERSRHRYQSDKRIVVVTARDMISKQEKDKKRNLRSKAVRHAIDAVAQGVISEPVHGSTTLPYIYFWKPSSEGSLIQIVQARPQRSVQAKVMLPCPGVLQSLCVLMADSLRCSWCTILRTSDSARL